MTKAEYRKKQEERQWAFTLELIQFHLDRTRLPREEFEAKYKENQNEQHQTAGD